MNVSERIAALRFAESDLERGLSHAWGEQRLTIKAKLERIRRQIAMLTEDARQPSAMPIQRRRFS